MAEVLLVTHEMWTGRSLMEACRETGRTDFHMRPGDLTPIKLGRRGPLTIRNDPSGEQQQQQGIEHCLALPDEITPTEQTVSSNGPSSIRTSLHPLVATGDLPEEETGPISPFVIHFGESTTLAPRSPDAHSATTATRDDNHSPSAGGTTTMNQAHGELIAIDGDPVSSWRVGNLRRREELEGMVARKAPSDFHVFCWSDRDVACLPLQVHGCEVNTTVMMVDIRGSSEAPKVGWK